MDETHSSTRLPCIFNSIYTGTMCSWKLVEMFKPRLLKKSRDHTPWKVSLFVGHEFTRERQNKPYRKFYMKKAVLLAYRMVLRMLGFDGWIADVGFARTGRWFRAWCSVQGRVGHRYTSSLVSFESHALYLDPCGIWRWVIHLGFERQGHISQKFTTGNRKVSKNVNGVKPPAVEIRIGIWILG
jgi:hypothetical protein